MGEKNWDDRLENDKYVLETAIKGWIWDHSIGQIVRTAMYKSPHKNKDLCQIVETFGVGKMDGFLILWQ